MKQLTKTIKDYKDYLDHIEKLAKPLNEEQKYSLNMLLRAQLTFLVALKRDSKLGSVSLNWLLGR